MKKIVRRHNENTMEIEVAPWEESSDIGMKKLYTDLAIEKTVRNPSGLCNIQLKNHSRLFRTIKKQASAPLLQTDERVCNDSNQHTSSYCGLFCFRCLPLRRQMPTEKTSSRSNSDVKPKEQKIFLAGKTGTGKTTFGKQLAHDWANGSFKAFTIVFFIVLKLVKPSDSIETVILNQIPELRSSSITEQNIRGLLDKFGDKCLLIFDGFDEYNGEKRADASNRKDDIFLMINNIKNFHCNILVTSRPHCTGTMEKFFKRFNIMGFRKTESERFVLKFFDEGQHEKISLVSEYQSLLFDNGAHQYQSPILLSVMCSLVSKNVVSWIDRPAKVIAEVVLCLCKYYSRRKGEKFSFNQYVSVVKKLGPLALKMLISDNYSPYKSQVIKDLGEEAFAFGLLVGQEGYFYLSKNTGDISLSFLHPTIEQFLGAFHFVQIPGNEMESFFRGQIKRPIDLVNETFLDFCFWFLFNKDEHFNCVEGESKQDELPLKFFERTLDGCDKRVLPIFNSVCGEAEGASFRIFPLFDLYVKDWLNFVGLTNFNFVVFVRIFIDEFEFFLRYYGRNPLFNFCLCIENGSEIMPLPHLEIHKLQIGSEIERVFSKIILRLYRKLTPFCHYRLTHLSIVSHIISYNTFRILSRAVKKRQLPRISHMSLIDCEGTSKQGNECIWTLHLKILFQYPWPELTHLNLYESDLDKTDTEALCTSSKLPKLKSLVISVDSVLHKNEAIPLLWEQPLKDITSFILDGPNETVFEKFVSALSESKFPNVITLAIFAKEASHKLRVKRLDFLDFFLDFSLKSLILFDFVKNEDDLHDLYVNTRVIRPTLSRLDLSHSFGIRGELCT